MKPGEWTGRIGPPHAVRARHSLFSTSSANVFHVALEVVAAFMGGPSDPRKRSLPDYSFILCRLHRGIGRQSEAQDQGKGIVYGSKLVGIEASGGISQALWIDNDSLLHQNTGLVAVQTDGWAKRGWTRAGRGRRHEGRAQCHELVSLNDDRISGASLLPSAGVAWGG